MQRLAGVESHYTSVGQNVGTAVRLLSRSPTPPHASRRSSVRELERRPCESQGANLWAWRRAGSLTGMTGTGESTNPPIPEKSLANSPGGPGVAYSSNLLPH